jgi:2-oxo-4-hydroxy-4-carboxy-5-ureidoimidazoline decarboxylase
VSKLEWLNGLPLEEAKAQFLRCCGASRWAEAMARARPFKNESSVYAEAGWLWSQTGQEDWREAISHYPRIGDPAQQREHPSSEWVAEELQGLHGASLEVLQALAVAHREYEARFGFIFILSATGRGAQEILEQLRERMNNPPALELRISAGEQAQITRHRLEKLLTSP